MFVARRGSWLTPLLACGGVMAFCCISSPAADRVKITGSDNKVATPEITNQQRELEKLLNANTPDKKSPNVEGITVPLMPPTGSGSALFRNKKVEEYLDQQKNWIFLTPQMSTRSLTPEEALGVQKDNNNTNSFQGGWSEKAVQRYYTTMHEQEQAFLSRARKETTGEGDKMEKIDPFQRSGFTWNSSSNETASMPKAFDLKSFDGSDPQRKATALNPVLATDSSFTALLQGDYLNRTGPDRTPAWQAGKDFQQLLNPTKSIAPLGGAPLGGLRDPMNLFADSSRNSLQPVVASTFDALGQGGSRRDPLNPFSELNQPDRLGRLNAFDELNAKVFGSGSLAPTLITPAPSPMSQPKPFVFEIPKRKF